MLKVTNQQLANEILASSIGERARAINDIRHQCTNYDDYVSNAGNQYEQITTDVRQIVSKIIEDSSLNKYQRYLYQLLNTKWNFHKKNQIERDR